MRQTWIFLLLATVVLFVAVSNGAVAQMVVCDGRNHLSTTTTGNWGLPSARTLGVRYVPTSTVIIERLEMYFEPSTLSPGLVGGTLAIILEDVTSGTPSTSAIAIIASVQWSSTQALPAWDGGTFSGPAILQAGTPYWLTTTAAPVSSHQRPAHEDTGPDPTTYAIDPTSSGAWVIISTPHQFKVRLLSSACTAAGVATVSSVGSGCAGSNGTPNLTSTGGMVPVLGNGAFALEVQNAAVSSTSYWFLAVNAQVNSIPLGAGCAVHLDPTSLLSFLTAGLNPLFIVPTDGVGFAQVPLPIPNDPGLTGLTAAFQVLISDPAATLGFTTTNALEMMLGI